MIMLGWSLLIISAIINTLLIWFGSYGRWTAMIWFICLAGSLFGANLLRVYYGIRRTLKHIKLNHSQLPGL